MTEVPVMTVISEKFPVLKSALVTLMSLYAKKSYREKNIKITI